MSLEGLPVVFVSAFVVVSFVYAFLSAFTTVFYRNKYPENLSRIESEILQGRAGIGKRFAYFFFGLLCSFMAPPIYIIAGLVTLIAYLAHIVIV
ncbi:hypothetical protein KJ652_06080 [Patescibacteria group bacterium]|nr:hypothetical protein [Patescibacteria group bacterium]